MASQPANSTISVEYTVRSYRQALRQEAILPLLGGVLGGNMRGAVMSVPGREFLVDETRDNTVLVTTALDENRDGLPVVRFLSPVVTLKAAVDGIADLAFPKRIGRDVFLLKDSTHLTDDLHADLRSV